MENEKVKEIKKGLKYCANDDTPLNKFAYIDNNKCKFVAYTDILTLINELESENERLSKEKEDLRLFDIALGNGKVDMTLGGNTAKSFINAIVQIFEQNNATNFLATTIETISSGNKYSLVIQKENGQTPSEKLTELKDRIAELEKENQSLKESIEYGNEVSKECQADKDKGVKWKLKQFAERLKEKLEEFNSVNNGLWLVDTQVLIDETLKECLCDNNQ